MAVSAFLSRQRQGWKALLPLREQGLPCSLRPTHPLAVVGGEYRWYET